MSDALSARKRSTLFDGLRNGQDVATAAEAAGVGVRQVFTAARTDTALALLLAGTDPDDPGATGIIKRAEYLRLLALGCTPSLAAQILLDGTGKASGWRREDPAFAQACDAAGNLASGQPAPARAPRFTPERRRAFLDHLEAGLSVTAAAAEVGITTAVIYQRRKRDPAFAAAMDTAHHAQPRTPDTTPGTDEWDAFFRALRPGVALRQAALAAGIRPEAVYDRRRADHAFAHRTNQQRTTR
ncbi:hypothetical protein AB0M92_39010 [Streptomyces sp. NPDC051582]|uniref:hypothetical protein n=1 Tax=Streptomyces sp. NPDC051582 TaxID=3155167 RepID=UPI0034461E94